MLLFTALSAQGKREDDAKNDAKAAPPQIWQAIHSDAAWSICSRLFRLLCLAFPRSVGRKANIAPPLQGIIGNIFVSVNNQHETSPEFFLYDTISSKGFVRKEFSIMPDRLVYSTDGGRINTCPRCGLSYKQCRCDQPSSTSSQPIRKSDGIVRIMRDRKHRGGKTVTVIT